MKKTIQLLVATSFLVLATGCSDLNQDPLANKPGALNNFTQKPTQPEPQTPVQSDAIRIDTTMMAFEDGRTSEFTIRSRVLLPDPTEYEVVMSLENAQDFPGASFDGQTAKFTWTPYKVVTGDELQVERPLLVKVVATKKNGRKVQRAEEILVRIKRVAKEPKIVKVDIPKNGVREGTVETIVVKVVDDDASNDTASWPQLVIKNPKAPNSLTGYMDVTSPTMTGPGEFDFKVLVDLRGVELVKSSEGYRAAIQAASRFNKFSQVEDVYVSVKNQLGALQTTWNERVDFVAGSTADYQFMIFDPKGEGDVRAVRFQRLPTNAKADCLTVNRSMMSCRLVWKIDINAPAPQRLDIDAIATMRSVDYLLDPQEINQNLILKLNIVKPVVPAPQGDR